MRVYRHSIDSLSRTLCTNVTLLTYTLQHTATEWESIDTLSTLSLALYVRMSHYSHTHCNTLQQSATLSTLYRLSPSHTIDSLSRTRSTLSLALYRLSLLHSIDSLPHTLSTLSLALYRLSLSRTLSTLSLALYRLSLSHSAARPYESFKNI